MIVLIVHGVFNLLEVVCFSDGNIWAKKRGWSEKNEIEFHKKRRKTFFL